MRKTRPAEDRFFDKVVEDPETGCWNWTGHRRPTGYGWFGVTSSRPVMAHRWVYEFMVADIPPGLVIDHLCRNRACVNPWHLDPVTQAVNIRRGDSGWATGRTYAARSACRKGHELTPDNVRIEGRSRKCRACARERTARHRARKRAA